MRAKSLILLLLALGCGLVASIGISQVIDRNKQPAPAAVETAPILVALKPINSTERIKLDKVKLEQWPKDKIPKGALTKPEEVENQRAKITMFEGEPIVRAKLMGEEDRRPTVEVPPGYRLVAAPADSVSAVGNLIQPGDRVDVLVYVKANFNNTINQAGAMTILQDIKVFAVNDQWRSSEDKGSESIAAKTVSLLVTPEQAEKLTLAEQLGKLKLVLRSPDDNLKVESTDGTSPQDLFGQTEKFDRDAFEKARDAANGASKMGSGLLSMLSGAKAEAKDPADHAAMVDLPPPPEQFLMEIMEGSALRKVRFVKQPGPGGRWESEDTGASRSNGPSVPAAGPALPTLPASADAGNPLSPTDNGGDSPRL